MCRVSTKSRVQRRKLCQRRTSGAIVLEASLQLNEHKKEILDRPEWREQNESYTRVPRCFLFRRAPNSQMNNLNPFLTCDSIL